MIRTTLDYVHIKRTLRELYGHTQSTPKDVLLDPAWDRSVQIYPGMVAMNKATNAAGASDVCTLIDATGAPYGLFGEFIGGYGIDEPLLRGINAISVWVLSSGSEFEVLAPAFDTTATWTFPTNGTPLPIFAVTAGPGRGKICPAAAGAGNTAGTIAIGRALSRPSTDRLIIAGLIPVS